MCRRKTFYRKERESRRLDAVNTRNYAPALFVDSTCTRILATVPSYFYGTCDLL